MGRCVTASRMAIVVCASWISASQASAQSSAQAAGAVVLPRPATSLQTFGTAQMPWTVAIISFANSIPIKSCFAMRIELMDVASRAEPRNPTGARVSLMDFECWTS